MTLSSVSMEERVWVQDGVQRQQRGLDVKQPGVCSAVQCSAVVEELMRRLTDFRCEAVECASRKTMWRVETVRT